MKRGELIESKNRQNSKKKYRKQEKRGEIKNKRE